MDKRLVFEGLVDGGKVVFHRQHEARRELLQLPAGVHEGRRVRHELATEHELEKRALGSLEERARLGGGEAALLGEGKLRFGDVRSHAPEHLDRLLYGLAVLVLLEVALLEDGQGIIGELYAVSLEIFGLHVSHTCPFLLEGGSFTFLGNPASVVAPRPAQRFLPTVRDGACPGGIADGVS